MADKITTVRRRRLQQRLGRLDSPNLAELNRAVLVFLGFAGSNRPGEVAAPQEEPDL